MFRKWIVLMLMLVVGTTVIHAQDAAPRIGYFLKMDDNGVQQVYQLPMDGQSEARQVTHATSSVLTRRGLWTG